jgi:thioesterase domain-containing protein
LVTHHDVASVRPLLDSQDPTVGWDPWSEAAYRCTKIAAEHATLFEAPHVSNLATRLSAYVSEPRMPALP